MKIHEYQAKEILRVDQIPVPNGGIAESADQAINLAQAIGLPVAIKAQVHIGGRGKAGGIKLAKTEAEVKEFAGQILNMKIKGLLVKKVLVEQALEIDKEYYLGITVDRANKSNTLMFSTVGGVDIEDVARTQPDKIIKKGLPSPFYPEHLDVARCCPELVEGRSQGTGRGGKGVRELGVSEIPNEFIQKLIETYFAVDANLAEINPLVKTKEGKFIAGDAKIVVDDNALFRHPELAGLADESEEDEIEAEARRRKIAYVRLPGNIGIIGNGAGLVMSTMDEVKRAGGKPASFLDVGGGAKAGLVKSCLEILTRDKNIKGIFFNVFGGITRCDEVAKGLIEAKKSLDLKVPLVVRLTGTREEEGRKLLSQSDLVSVASMQEGASKIVGLSK